MGQPPKMNLLKSVETTISSLVEGAFGRLFRSEVRPMELARKLVREMDEHRTVSVSRVYVPNEYSIWLSPEDRERYKGVEDEVIDELSAYLLEHARREDLIMASHPIIIFQTDERLRLGEFGIQARLVRPRGRARAAGHAPGARGGGSRPHDDLQHLRAGRGARRRRRPAGQASACAAARRRRGASLVAPSGGVIGRSRECDIVLDDAGVSRKHAEIRPSLRRMVRARPRLDQRRSRQRLAARGRARARPTGDRIEIGSTELRLRTVMNSLEPVSVALKFGFLAVLYLFLFWVARSARQGPERPAKRHPGPWRGVRACTSRRHRAALGLLARPRRGSPELAAPGGPARSGPHPGMIYDLDGEIVLGRGERAEIRLQDPFASSRHALIYEQGNIVVIEDLDSTNGTYLNEELLQTPRPLHPGDRVRIGDSEFEFEAD